MNIYVGNLSYEVTEEMLKQTFETFGEINSVKIIKDNYSGQSKGFGFVEMPNDSEAQKAIAELNGSTLQGRTITVNEARPRNETRGGGRGFSGGRGYGGGRGGRGRGR